MPLAAGTRLGPYGILEPIGAGGMGEVYRARDTRLRRDVAVKVLPAECAAEPDRLERFQREALATAALSHPNILAIHDIGTHEGRPFLVEELLEGETLRHRLGAGRLPLREATEIAVQVARGLAAAHEKQIVHRDIKPENVFLTRDGGVKVLDFGLARLRVPADPQAASALPTATCLTATGAIVGTTSYMSPEQVRGQACDARSDVFSFGVLAHEMLAGRRPFDGETPADVLAAILQQEPGELPGDVGDSPLARIVRRCLAKRPEDRFESARDLTTELVNSNVPLGPSNVPREASDSSQAEDHVRARSRLRRPVVVVLVAGLLVLTAVAAALGVARSRQRRWALEVALPEITRLADDEHDLRSAYRLAVTAEQLIPENPVLLRQWAAIARYVSVHTDPPGATVRIRPYGQAGAEWTSLSVMTPINAERIPRGFHHWRIERPGFKTLEFASDGVDLPPANASGVITLDTDAAAPEAMVRVPGGKTVLDLPGLYHAAPVELPAYWIDRYEVTNLAYLDFVRKGGYLEAESWLPALREALPGSSMADVVARCRDATGRPAPARWVLGEFPEGAEHDPVSGVSWFEAAAYCRSMGKQLPSLYHWYRAAGTGLASQIVPVSNFSGKGPRGVEDGPPGPFGAHDMAGNVREWIWNGGAGGRYALGGAWNEPAYVFTNAGQSQPFERSVGGGFRCMKTIEGSTPPAEAFAAVPAPEKVVEAQTVSEAEFRVYERLYAYDRTPLEALVELVETKGDFRRERVSLRAAYGNERYPVLLFVPLKTKPPFQVVVYFPGSDALSAASSRDLWTGPVEFLVKSGRAVCLPIYKGTYERQTGLKDDDPDVSTAYRDHAVMWAKDLGRAIDYLETRPDLDTRRLAYYGISWGAAVGAVLPAVEKRIRMAVLDAGGLFASRALPEADQRTFAPRVAVPILMVNGRYDWAFPVATSQQPLFRMLGTQAADKTHVLLESGHWERSPERIRTILDWLDKEQL